MFLQIVFDISEFNIAILSFITAFVVAMIFMPPLIKMINYLKLYDLPGSRKEHIIPIPTMGGIAVFAGMSLSILLWFRFYYDPFLIAFFFSIVTLLLLGIMDDMKNIPHNFKFVIQVAVAFLIAFCGVRIESLNGLMNIYELPVLAQYSLTILAIVGITNAFNLMDGIDGLAGGIGFMSLLIIGLFLVIGKEHNLALISFALAGGVLGFLYYNFNPARIFMGDTGSLLLGFVIAVLCIKILSSSDIILHKSIPHAPVFVLGIVFIPVFDTLRVFSLRIWCGKSPFIADKTHIHHLLTNNGWSHGFTSKIICFVHGLILILAHLLKDLRQEIGIVILFTTMLIMVLIFKRIRLPYYPLLKQKQI